MKKLLSFLLCGVIFCSTLVPAAFAENFTTNFNDNIIEARFSDFDMVYATMYETDAGFYHVEGGASTTDTSKWVEITLTIESCGMDGSYHPVDGMTWTDSDYALAATQATRDLPGGAYKAHTVAKCYRNGVLLETVEAYSNVVNVPYV